MYYKNISRFIIFLSMIFIVSHMCMNFCYAQYTYSSYNPYSSGYSGYSPYSSGYYGSSYGSYYPSTSGYGTYGGYYPSTYGYGAGTYGGGYGGYYPSMYGYGAYGSSGGLNLGGINPFMSGLYGGSNPFGLQNMYYTIDSGSGLSYQIPFTQIAPLLGMAGLYNAIFPSLF